VKGDPIAILVQLFPPTVVGVRWMSFLSAVSAKNFLFNSFASVSSASPFFGERALRRMTTSEKRRGTKSSKSLGEARTSATRWAAREMRLRRWAWKPLMP